MAMFDVFTDKLFKTKLAYVFSNYANNPVEPLMDQGKNQFVKRHMSLAHNFWEKFARL